MSILLSITPELVDSSNVNGFCIYLKSLKIRLIIVSNWFDSKNCVKTLSGIVEPVIFIIGEE